MSAFLGYVRVSRIGDREETLVSPELQADRIRTFAASRNLEVTMLDPELDVSGSRVRRPILDQAIADIEAGNAAGLIVAQLDRLSRMSLIEALRVIRRIEDAGGEVLAAGEAFDTTTPEGRMGRNVFLSMGEMQLERYKAQFADAKRQAVERGIWATSVVPRGYRKGPDRHLEPDPETAPAIIRAFELRANGESWSTVADYLGIGNSGAGKIVKNRAYLGEVRIGDWVNRAAHPPIVSLALFEAAQLRHPRPPRGTHGPALLSNLLRCAGCQRVMTPDGERYRCFARNAHGRCESPSIIARRLVEPLVERTVLSHLADLTYTGSERTDELDYAYRQIADAEAELNAFQEAVNASTAGPEHFARGLDRRVAEVEMARQDLGVAQSRSQPIAKSSGRVLELWPSLNVEEKRHVLRGALGVVWVRKGRGNVANRLRLIATGYEPRHMSRPGVSAGPVIPLAWDAHLDGEIPVTQDTRNGFGSTSSK